MSRINEAFKAALTAGQDFAQQNTFVEHINTPTRILQQITFHQHIFAIVYFDKETKEATINFYYPVLRAHKTQTLVNRLNIVSEVYHLGLKFYRKQGEIYPKTHTALPIDHLPWSF